MRGSCESRSAFHFVSMSPDWCGAEITRRLYCVEGKLFLQNTQAALSALGKMFNSVKTAAAMSICVTVTGRTAPGRCAGEGRRATGRAAHYLRRASLCLFFSPPCLPFLLGKFDLGTIW